MKRPLFSLRCLCFLVIAAMAAQGKEILTDSQTDFSNEQGGNGWRYLTLEDNGRMMDMNYDADTRKWAAGDGGIWVGGMHPVSTNDYVVREWTVSEDGEVLIEGSAALFADAAGVTLIVLKNYEMNEKLWSADLNTDEKTEFSFKTRVTKGDTLNFMIIGRTGVGIRNDSTEWLFTISNDK